jgi:general secretion pathway protein A
MYLDYYNLRELPFNLTPDPHFIYYARHYREAYEHLLFGILNRRGFIELTGEVGSGKTTLCRAVLDSLDNNTETALIVNPPLTEPQLLRAILTDLGIRPSGGTRMDYLDILNEFLLDRNSEGKNVALIIDEAQGLTPEVMEQLRLISNLETDRTKLIQVVLCGQPELQLRLARPDLRQLRQRITIRYHIPPLTLEETGAYVAHRLRVAGADRQVAFAPVAVRRVHRYTRGIPRAINAVCDHALLAGYVDRKSVIDGTCVKKAIRQLEGPS